MMGKPLWHKPLKPGEITTEVALPCDASVGFIGHVETPWRTLADCPKSGGFDGPECRVILLSPWDQALHGIERCATLDIVLWFHLARRDLLVINPPHAEAPRGVFTFRAPVRPNPVALSTVRLVAVAGNQLIVRGLEAVDGTPLIDIKPGRAPQPA